MGLAMVTQKTMLRTYLRKLDEHPNYRIQIGGGQVLNR
jgi:hypothetical protein